MKIAFVNLNALSAIDGRYAHLQPGGEERQHALLARAFAQRGHEVSLVVFDRGQPAETTIDGVRLIRAYAPERGLPVVRFFHPRTTGVWRALAHADADVVYVSCAGALVGQVAAWTRRHGRALVFRIASDTDCDPQRLLVPQPKDRWLYRYGLRAADRIVAQTEHQRIAMREGYGLHAHRLPLVVDPAETVLDEPARDIDVIWIANLRRLKRPDRFLELAGRLPHARLHLVGGRYDDDTHTEQATIEALKRYPNVQWHGRVEQAQALSLLARAKVFVNTSDVEGFPNTYLQAWERGVPVATFIDPDGIIGQEGLGAHVASVDALATRVGAWLSDRDRWQHVSQRVRAYSAQHHRVDRVVEDYEHVFAAAWRERSGKQAA